MKMAVIDFNLLDNKTALSGTEQIFLNDSGTVKDVTVDVMRNHVLKFPSTQFSSADVNTLDDYEEGTWVPEIFCSGGGTITYYFVEGTYTKIGRLVHISCSILINTLTGTSGDLFVIGVPFTIDKPVTFSIVSRKLLSGKIDSCFSINSPSGINLYSTDTDNYAQASQLKTETGITISGTYNTAT
jgi:hypothetical protein